MKLTEAQLGIIRRLLKPIVKEVLGQLTTPQGATTSTTNVSTSAIDPNLQQQVDPADVKKQNDKIEADRRETLKQSEKELSNTKKEDDARNKLAKQRILSLRDKVTSLKK